MFWILTDEQIEYINNSGFELGIVDHFNEFITMFDLDYTNSQLFDTFEYIRL